MTTSMYCMYVCNVIYVCMLGRMGDWMYVCMYVIYVCMGVGMYVCMYVNIQG